jgi:hypothetical protein
LENDQALCGGQERDDRFREQEAYLIVPRHALNEAQWTEMRALVAAKVRQS